MDELSPLSSDKAEREVHGNNLGVVNGVWVPCMLNIVGAILFLRLSWAVGQAGFLGVMIMFFVAEIQCVLTALSLSAMITNGEMKGGGSYYIISRSVGPELGGAIGVLFYFAYSVGATFYVVAFATSLNESFFPNQTILSKYWMQVLVGSLTLIAVLVVSLVGAGFFTKVNTILFIVQFGAIAYGVFSILFAHGPGKLAHGGYFFGWGGDNFKTNFLWDYNEVGLCSNGKCNFQYVFSIVFPAVTGIMEGANLSGDLADPHRSIWRGTLLAIGASYFCYVMCMLAFAGVNRETLQINPFVFQDTSYFSEYFVIVGVLISTSSSALGAVFGGSRILQALARDKILPGLSWFAYGSKDGDEPRPAVIATFLIAEAALFVGDLDVIAPIITCFFCLSYAFTNLSCLLVAISGTPNFRPRFKYFTWHTAAIGFVLNIAVMFVLQYLYALIALLVWILLFIYLIVFFPPSSGWGDIRKAILYHQIRKYLFHLDPKENHGKLWRPSILLCIDRLDNPLTLFCNYLKKGGLYVLGSVVVGNLDDMNKRREETEVTFVEYVKQYNLKAFVQVFVANNLRVGFHNLIVGSGLGAMQCNTVVLPLLPLSGDKDTEGMDAINRRPEKSSGYSSLKDARAEAGPIASTRLLYDYLTSHDFIKIFSDAYRLEKNIVLAAHFNDSLDVKSMLEPTRSTTIDIWVPEQMQLDCWDDFEGTPLLQVELGHILKRNSNMSLRLIKVVHDHFSLDDRENLVDIVKRQGRFRVGSAGSQIIVVRRDGTPVSNSPHTSSSAEPLHRTRHSKGNQAPLQMSKDEIKNFNKLIKTQTKDTTALVILPLPSVPKFPRDGKESEYEHIANDYLHYLHKLSGGLPPTLFVQHAEGQNVMSTSI